MASKKTGPQAASAAASMSRPPNRRPASCLRPRRSRARQPMTLARMSPGRGGAGRWPSSLPGRLSRRLRRWRGFAAAFFAGLFFAALLLGQRPSIGAAAFDFLADSSRTFRRISLPTSSPSSPPSSRNFFFRRHQALLEKLLGLLPPFFFLPLAIVILLLPPTNIYRAFPIVRLKPKAHQRPNDQFNPGRGPPARQSRSSTVCTTGTDVPPAICPCNQYCPQRSCPA